MTPADLKAIMPYATAANCALYAPLLDAAMAEFLIDTPVRQAAFLAQLAHESGSLRYNTELASGQAYEGRTDLGNSLPGDGVRFKGRGLIQVTGRANYAAVSAALGVDFLEHPTLLAEPENACRSAGWFWQSRGLNALADSGDFVRLTKRINGGTNGLADRQMHWAKAKAVLNA